MGFQTRRTAITLILTGMAAMWAGSSLRAAEGIKSGDKIVFLGDSITQAGAGPMGYVTLVKESLAKDHPDLNVEIIGAGISGNRVPDLEARLERDVLSKQPTVVVIYIGINDVWHSQQGRGTPKDAFDAGLRRIISQIQQAGSKVILCTASVIGEKTDGSNKLDAMLDEYCDISRKVAKETNSQLLDLRKEFLSYLKEHNKDNAENKVLTTDGVHLNAAGNQFVAKLMEGALLNQKSSKTLRHVVLFKFKDEVTPEQVDEVVKAFGGLKDKISQITDFEWGTDVSVENKAAGFTHGFVVSFASAEDRDAYLPHPAHQEFVKLVGPRIAEVLVFDFWAQK